MPAATLSDSPATVELTSFARFAAGSAGAADVLAGRVRFGAAPTSKRGSAWHWVRLIVHANANALGPWILIFPHTVTRGEAFVPEVHGYREFQLGTGTPYGTHPQPFLMVSLPLDREAIDTGKPLYLHLTSQPGSPLWIHAELQNDRMGRSFVLRLIQGLFFGVLLALGFCYLYVAIAVRDRSAGWFVAYIAALIANELVTTGLGALYLWPGIGLDQFWPSVVTTILVFGTFLGFARSFLQTRAAAPFWDRLLIAAFLAVVVTDVTQHALQGSVNLAPVTLTVQFLAMLVTVFAGVVRMRAGFRPAAFFVLAFAPAIVGITANLAYQVFTPPGNWFFAQNGVEFGAMFECVVLSFSLLDRIGTLDAERSVTRAALSRTERRNVELKTLATRDPLTNLYNRLAFFENFEEEMEAARHSNLLLGVLYMDLDGFKQINDRQGHRIGDLSLQIFAKRLERAVRPSDTVARLGGDEFAVLVAGVSSASVLESVRDNVNHILDTPIMIEGKRIPLRMSIGLSIYPRDGAEVDRLIEAADHQMYAAKQMRSQALAAEESTTPV